MSNIEKLTQLQKKSHTEAFQREIDRHTKDDGSINSSWWWINSKNPSYIRHVYPFYICKNFFKSLPPKKILNMCDGKGGCESNFFKELHHMAVSADQVTSALKIAKDIGFIDEYYEENAEDMSFADESFDYVIVKESLHHLARPYMALYEMLRVAKEGIYIVEPNDASYSIGEETYETSGNFRFFFSRKELVKVFTALGYTNIYCRRLFDPEDIIEDCRDRNIYDRDTILREISQHAEEHTSETGQFECIFCFKNPPDVEHLDRLISCGWSRLNIKENIYIE